MTDPFFVLLLSAATLGIIHTALGVDHSLPFVVLAKTRSWSLKHTLGVTLLCGVGHVLSSVTIASVGLGLGIAGGRLSLIEETRGHWAAWLLVGFGFAYAAVAWCKARSVPFPQTLRAHHGSFSRWLTRAPQDGAAMGQATLIPGLFVIFCLGPCEALLPLLTASGVTLRLEQSAWVTLVFSCATVLTMMGLVTIGFLLSSTGWLEQRGRFTKHSHSLAGLALIASGVTIEALGI